MGNYAYLESSLVYAHYTVFKDALVSYVGSGIGMDQIAITSDKSVKSAVTKSAWDEKIDQRKKQLQEAKGEK